MFALAVLRCETVMSATTCAGDAAPLFLYDAGEAALSLVSEVLCFEFRGDGASLTC